MIEEVEAIEDDGVVEVKSIVSEAPLFMVSEVAAAGSGGVTTLGLEEVEVADVVVKAKSIDSEALLRTEARFGLAMAVAGVTGDAGDFKPVGVESIVTGGGKSLVLLVTMPAGSVPSETEGWPDVTE